jgi:hypothetical protein
MPVHPCEPEATLPNPTGRGHRTETRVEQGIPPPLPAQPRRGGTECTGGAAVGGGQAANIPRSGSPRKCPARRTRVVGWPVSKAAKEERGAADVGDGRPAHAAAARWSQQGSQLQHDVLLAVRHRQGDLGQVPQMGGQVTEGWGRRVRPQPLGATVARMADRASMSYAAPPRVRAPGGRGHPAAGAGRVAHTRVCHPPGQLGRILSSAVRCTSLVTAVPGPPSGCQTTVPVTTPATRHRRHCWTPSAAPGVGGEPPVCRGHRRFLGGKKTRACPGCSAPPRGAAVRGEHAPSVPADRHADIYGVPGLGLGGGTTAGVVGVE